jgi:hypothetical protein
MAETQESNAKLDGSVPQEQVNSNDNVKRKSILLYFSVLKLQKKSNELVKKKKPLKSNIPKLFKNLIELIQNIWMI